mmetsp:Transcript_90937/g.294289  ORF Transcript_90937/g.294289 Transcript_90937/m.294289 type:complete len:291 (-) Transcript_90937:1682-2554(-)
MVHPGSAPSAVPEGYPEHTEAQVLEPLLSSCFTHCTLRRGGSLVLDILALLSLLGLCRQKALRLPKGIDVGQLGRLLLSLLHLLACPPQLQHPLRPSRVGDYAKGEAIMHDACGAQLKAGWRCQRRRWCLCATLVSAMHIQAPAAATGCCSGLRPWQGLTEATLQRGPEDHGAAAGYQQLLHSPAVAHLPRVLREEGRRRRRTPGLRALGHLVPPVAEARLGAERLGRQEVARPRVPQGAPGRGAVVQGEQQAVSPREVSSVCKPLQLRGLQECWRQQRGRDALVDQPVR